MKKAVHLLLSFGLILIISISSASAQTSFGSSLADYGMSGRVKAMIQSSHEAINTPEGYMAGKEHTISEDNYWVVFAAQGWVLQASDVNMFGGTTARTSNQLDKQGRRFQSKTTVYNMKDMPLNSLVMDYDYSGKPTLEQWYVDLVPTFKRVYSYDSEGRLNKISDGNKLGVGTIHYTIEYNESSQPILISKLKQKGQLQERYSYSYNEKGNVATINVHKGNDAQIGSAKITYNHHDDIATAQIIGEVENALLLYNRVTEKKALPTELKNGNHIFDYTYDPRGNWEQCAMIHNDSPQRILIREIEYFY